MKNFFSLYGPVYRIADIIYAIIFSSLLWIIFSLPIFTIGASTSALYYVIGKSARDEEVKMIRDFTFGFIKNFKQATAIWLITMIVLILLYLNIANASILKKYSKYILPLQIGVFIEVLIGFMYGIPILVIFDIPTRELLKLSFYISNRYIYYSVFFMIIIYLTVNLVLNYSGLIIFAAGLDAFIFYKIIDRILKKMDLNIFKINTI